MKKEKIKMNDEEFRDWYFETLREKSYKLLPYYDIDKVKAYGCMCGAKKMKMVTKRMYLTLVMKK